MFKGYLPGLLLALALMPILVALALRIARQPTLIGCAVLLVRTRYSVLTGLFLLGLPLIGWIEPGMSRAVFVLRNPWQFASLTWATLMVSLMVLVTFRVCYLTGPARFGEIPNARIPQFWGTMNNTTWCHSWWIWAVLGLMIPVYSLDQSLSERQADSSLYWYPLGLLAGILCAVCFLFLLAALQRMLIDPSITTHGLLPFENLRWIRSLKPPERPATKLENTVARVFGPRVAAPETSATRGSHAAPASRATSTGYIWLRDPHDPESWEWEPGHAQIALVWMILAMLYVGLYGAILGAIGDGSVDAWLPNQDGTFPTLFFLMIPVFFTGLTLAETAFFLDYYRIPTMLFVLGLVMVAFSLGRVDHFYELNPDALVANASPQLPPPQVPLTEAFDHWQFPAYAPPATNARGLRPESTLVVVTAAGGGIQASAWTARVLTGLDEIFDGFSESVGMISSVSGGSVGAMFYLHHRGDRTNQPAAPMRIDADTAANILADASASGLEPAAWGMAFPDLMRTAFPPAAPQTLDRGTALELEWQRRLADRVALDPKLTGEGRVEQRLAVKDVRLLDWGARVRAGKMPIIVFNSTLVDTGQRLLFSPVVAGVNATNAPPASGYSVKASEPVEFFPCYAGQEPGFFPNPRLVTAVRLSATFSYVSPTCRPYADGVPMAARSRYGQRLFWHVADGGYSDNEGILTATKWIEKVLAAHRDRRHSSKLPFERVLIVRINGFPDLAAETGSDKTGLLNAFLGPVLALSSVRVASQAERGDYEVQLLEEATRLRRAKKLQEAQQLLTSASEIHTRLESGLAVETASDRAIQASGSVQSPQVQQVVSDNLQEQVDRLKQVFANRAVQVQDDISNQTQQIEQALNQSRDKRREYDRNIEVRSLKIRFPADLQQPPLSWALTPSDQRQIEIAWQKIAEAIRQAESYDHLPEVGSADLTPAHLRYYFPLREAAAENAER